MAVAAKFTQPEWTQWTGHARKCGRSWSASAFCVTGVNPVANVLQRVHSCLLVRSW